MLGVLDPYDMKHYKYCPKCKTALEESHVDGRDRSSCAECGWINYCNPLPVTSCLVKNSKGEILLIKRGIEPAIGCWAIPGGFIELDESPEEAGVRELFEETGLKGKTGRLVGVKRHESSIYGAILMVGYEYIIEDEILTVGDDAIDAKFFPVNNLPEIPFPTHLELISEFLNLS